jgi:hypothetical protein
LDSWKARASSLSSVVGDGFWRAMEEDELAGGRYFKGRFSRLCWGGKNRCVN